MKESKYNTALTNPRGKPLSPRQQTVSKLICQGLNNKHIAIELGCSEQTIKNHVSAIMARLGAYNRAHVAAMWVRSEESSMAVTTA